MMKLSLKTRIFAKSALCSRNNKHHLSRRKPAKEPLLQHRAYLKGQTSTQLNNPEVSKHCELGIFCDAMIFSKNFGQMKKKQKTRWVLDLRPTSNLSSYPQLQSQKISYDFCQYAVQFFCQYNRKNRQRIQKFE